VVLEYSLLRECILRRWGSRIDSPRIESGISVLNRAIDRAIAASADSYSHARDRTLHALDRISAAALEAQGLDDLLHRLLDALVETTAAVDSAVIYLSEPPNWLRPRATAGVGRGIMAGRTLRFGQGLAGHVAQVRRPILRSASKGPLEPDTLVPPGTRAVYGVPLIDGSELIGVAQIGSHSAWDFSEQDKLLFFAMANRATSAIVQQLLREANEKRARELAAEVERRRALEAVVSVHPDFMYLLDVRQRVTWANASLLRLWGKTLEEAIGKTFAELGHPRHLVKQHTEELKRALAGETVRGSSEYTSPSGQTGLYEYLFVPVRDPDGVVRAIAGTTREISERVPAGTPGR
jgi:PAS domain S-box-containing protein